MSDWGGFMEWASSWNHWKRLMVFSCVMLLLHGSETIVWGQRGALRELRAPRPTWHAQVLHLRIDHTVDEKFDLSSLVGLQKLLTAVERVKAEAEAQEDQLQNRRGQLEKRKPRASMTQAELRAYFAEPEDLIGKRDRRGLAELERLGKLAQQSSAPRERGVLIEQMLEVANALYNNHRAPVPRVIEALQVPYALFDYSHNPIGVGTTLATNLALPVRGASDNGRMDPKPSSFWSRPKSIATQDLFHGFGRTEMPAFQETIWDYAEPKTSYGCCGGFEASSGKRTSKLSSAKQPRNRLPPECLELSVIMLRRPIMFPGFGSGMTGGFSWNTTSGRT